MDEGRLPETLTEDSCRFVNVLTPPMLVGIVPFSEGKLYKYKTSKLDKDPIGDGRDPDKDPRLLNPK
jgi:hypothetical protein